MFGDGTNGMAPPAGSASAPVTVTGVYRTGGGTAGNVPSGTSFTSSLDSLVEVVARAGGSGGGPAEDLDRARTLGPRLFRTQDRAVTAEDFVALALRHSGVGKARAVALGWNDVLLCVAPTGRVAEPSELLVRDLLAALESERMVTTRVKVRGPQPADVYLRAVVRAEAYYFQSDVRRAVEDAVAALLAYDAVEFGQPVYLSRLYDAAQSLPMVTSLTITQFSRDRDGGVDPGGVIELQPFELARPGYDPAILLGVEGGLAR
jgi:predicted phage baseplate assembly protein